MGRRPAHEIQDIRETLQAMASDELRPAGQRFVSARYVAHRFKVSYQTAHRLLRELESKGSIIRRAGSGSFIAGRKETLRSASLLFARRAKRSGSFGDLLLGRLLGRLESLGLPFDLKFGTLSPRQIPDDTYPVLWELPSLMHRLSELHRFSLVLHDKPPPGIGSLYTDSISVDDFSGGITAAQILSRYAPQNPAVIGGPASDARSQKRIQGFRCIFPAAQVVPAETWFFKSAVRNLWPRLSSLRPDALFCCSDRLAEAAMECYRMAGTTPPILIGFDNAPVAETLGLSTIGIPWEEVVRTGCSVIRKRLEGDTSHASAVVLPPVPVLRKPPADSAGGIIYLRKEPEE